MWIHNYLQYRLSKVSDKALAKSVEPFKINGYHKNIILYVASLLTYPDPFCVLLSNLLVEKNTLSVTHFQYLSNSRFHDTEHKLDLDMVFLTWLYKEFRYFHFGANYLNFFSNLIKKNFLMVNKCIWGYFNLFEV